MFSLIGVKSTDGIAVDTSKQTVTLKAANLNGKDVTFSKNAGSYTLALSGVSAPNKTDANWSNISSGKATYTFESNTAGYTLAFDKKSVTYTPAGKAKSFTVSGIKSTSGITVSGTTVTLKAANLDAKDVSITKGYKLSLAKDVPTSSVKNEGSFTTFKKGTATYKVTSYSDYYTSKNSKITYTAAKGGQTITIKGLNSKTNLAAIKSGIKVAQQKNGSYKITFNDSAVLASNAPTITADKGISYSLAVADKLKPATAPTWNVNGTNGSLTADTSAGYTVSGNKIIYSKKKTGSAQVVLSGLTKNAKLTAPSNKVLTIAATALGKNTSLKSNSGNYSLKLTGDMKGKTFTGTANADTINIAASNAAVIGGNGNDKLTLSGSNITVTGGKGNDVFVYEKGDNVIADFTAGDKISLGTAITKSTVSGTDAVFTIAKETLTVKKGKGKKIAFVDAKGNSRTIIGGAQIFTNSSSAKVTLSSGVEVGDVSARTKAINLTGNALNNTILGGTKNDSLYGGKGNDSLVGSSGNDKLYGQAGADTLIGGVGNDSLWGGTGNDLLYGGDGKDVFIYKPGEGTDHIMDYQSGDMLKILKSNGNAGGTFKSSKYSGGDLILTINGGGTVIFDGVSKGDKFNINGKTYTLGANKLK